MTNTTPIEEKFSDFYEKWVSQLEEYLRFLVQEYSHESDYENLVAKLTTHHKNYYRFKWAAAHEDVCAFFTPVWLTPLENAYLWVTGWKPSVLFRFLTALVDLSEEQVKKIEGLRVKIKMEEQKVEREMERQQVSMADRRTVEIVTCGGADVAGVLTGLEKVMKMGDCVRLKTLKGLLDLMNPKQCVELLAAQAMFHVQLRKCGKKMNHPLLSLSTNYSSKNELAISISKRAPTPADSVVRNTAGKGSKQTTDGPMPDEKLHEFYDKHYNQLLPLMAKKVHQEKLQAVQTRLTYGER
ncbi:DOG1-like protein 4 [Tanacetum coccineum]